MNDQAVASADALVTVVVVAWRRSPLLHSCLESVRREAETVPCEIVVVLNEPDDDLRSTVQRISGIQVLEFRANLGFGGAANVGAAAGSGEFVALLNDDAVAHAGWLSGLLDVMSRRAGCVAVGSSYLHPDGSLQEAGSVVWPSGHTGAVGDGNAASSWLTFERRVDYCSGGALLVRRAAWEAVGGFDERYYPAYYEDVDLCLRLAETQGEVWFQPASVVTHVRGASTGGAAAHDALMELNRHHFCARWGHWLDSRGDIANVETTIWAAMGRPRRVLVIDDRVPSYELGSGFGRMLDTLKALSSERGLAVTFHPVLPASEVDVALRAMGVRVVDDLDAHISDPGVVYDAAIISRPHNYAHYSGRLRARYPDLSIIYDAEALYSRRLEMQASLATNRDDRAGYSAEAEEMKEIELRILSDADHVVCISDDEAEAVRKLTASPVSVVDPWLASPGGTAGRSFAERSHVGFVAGWLPGPGGPNSDALLWYAKHVMPILRARVPWCRLLVTGRAPPADVTWLESYALTFVGEVPDLADFYESVRVVISPTRFGAGVKLKSVEAIQYGVPVVATSEGAAGLSEEVAELVSIRDDPEGFADAVAAFVADESAWTRCRDALVSFAASGRTRHVEAVWPALVHSVTNAMTTTVHA